MMVEEEKNKERTKEEKKEEKGNFLKPQRRVGQ
jgi:hypothetical protein